MKKSLMLLFVIALFSSLSFAQFKSSQTSFGATIGFGGSGLTGTGAMPIGLEYNFYEINKNTQLGGYFAFASSTDDLTYGKWTYTNIILGAQGNYHLSPGEKFDIFVGAFLGYNVASASWKWSNNPNNLPDPTVTAGGVVYSGQAGFNYWFKPNLAVQVRVGLFPYFGAGITYNM